VYSPFKGAVTLTKIDHAGKTAAIHGAYISSRSGGVAR
jgi:hypothetical protein